MLTDAEVAVEVRRLCYDLRQARDAAGKTGREVAEEAQITQSTVWRIETAQHQPTYLRFILLTLAADHLVDLDDGTGRPLIPLPLWPPSREYRYKPPISAGRSRAAQRRDDQQMDAQPYRHRIGSELWYARYRDMPEPLSAEEVCRRLDMNHHTLADVESGPGWPNLASVVRVAGLVGRQLVLNAREHGWRSPPWVTSTWRPTPTQHQ